MDDTKQAALKWVSELAPGDLVIHTDPWGKKAAAVLRIKNVTPTGIVRTEEGLSFKQNNWSDRFYVTGVASTSGQIVPYEENLAKEAEENQRKIAAEKENTRKIESAKFLCYELAYGKRKMCLELAETIIDACEKLAQKEGE